MAINMMMETFFEDIEFESEYLEACVKETLLNSYRGINESRLLGGYSFASLGHENTINPSYLTYHALRKGFPVYIRYDDHNSDVFIQKNYIDRIKYIDSKLEEIGIDRKANICNNSPNHFNDKFYGLWDYFNAFDYTFCFIFSRKRIHLPTKQKRKYISFSVLYGRIN